MEQIVDYSIYRLTKPEQYAVVFKLATNSWTRQYRIPNIVPTQKQWKLEPPDTMIEINKAAFLIMQDLIKSDTLQPANTRFKTCGEAMGAYLAWRSANRRNTHRDTSNAKPFMEKFGDAPLAQLTASAANTWVAELVESGRAYDTVRNRIIIASGMVSWMTDEGLWYPRNPFHGALKRHANKFPVSPPCPATVSVGRYAELQAAAASQGKHTAAVFMECCYCTGLRPSEVARLDTAQLDRDRMTWAVNVTKTHGRSFWRTIAVPPRLITFLAANGVQGRIVDSQTILRRQLESLGVQAKIFRKDFAHRMEVAGAPSDIINLHQGRSQSGVLYENYLTDPDRAVRLCREYVDRMFDNEFTKRKEARR